MPVKLNSSGGGSVTLDVPATATATNLTVPAANGTIVVADNSGNVTYSGTTTFSGNATFNAGLIPSSSFLRNRIINGDMRIDQRNAGASVTLTSGFTSASYAVDRWRANRGASSTATAQRSTIAPAGFTNSYLYTVGTGAAPAASDFSGIQQLIEGFNIADFGWGAAGAQSVTVSFWVRSSLTGTFGLVVTNSAQTLAYATTYTIAAANTFEFKTITIPGPTSATWLTDNGTGLQLIFDMGVGSNQSVGASASWQSGNFLGVTGVTKPLATSGATFYLTGVQLEVGSVATPFERRQYGQELALCQRYFSKSYETSVAIGAVNSNGVVAASATMTGAGGIIVAFGFPAEMRTTPTMTLYSGSSGSSGVWRDIGSGTDKAMALYGNTGTRGTSVYNTATWSAAGAGATGHWVANAEF